MSQPDFSIFPLGEHALTLEVSGGIDPAVNRRLQATRLQLLDSRIPGVRDVLAAYTSMTVYYDPWLANGLPGPGDTTFHRLAALVAAIFRNTDPAIGTSGRLHRIPVTYNGADLPAISAALGRSPDEVVALHSGSEYDVYLIGFLPGFPYLGLLPEALELPRKARPGPVKAGSVAIAGRQTGIYTVDSPGGWHVLGHTSLRLFDPAASPPVLLQPGDRVIFVPVTRT